jgi:hypothetical protein
LLENTSIVSQLENLADSHAKQWVSIGVLLEQAERLELWKPSSSFELWLRTKLAPSIKVSDPNLRMYLHLVKSYTALQSEMKARGVTVPSVSDLPTTISSERFELLFKIKKFAPAIEVDQTAQNIISGKMTRNQVRDMWRIYRLAAESKAAEENSHDTTLEQNNPPPEDILDMNVKAVELSPEVQTDTALETAQKATHQELEAPQAVEPAPQVVQKATPKNVPAPKAPKNVPAPKAPKKASVDIDAPFDVTLLSELRQTSEWSGYSDVKIYEVFGPEQLVNLKKSRADEEVVTAVAMIQREGEHQHLELHGIACSTTVLKKVRTLEFDEFSVYFDVMWAVFPSEYQASITYTPEYFGVLLLEDGIFQVLRDPIKKPEAGRRSGDLAKWILSTVSTKKV